MAGSSLSDSADFHGRVVPFGYARRHTWLHRASALHASLMACLLVLAASQHVFDLPLLFSSSDLFAPTSARISATLLGLVAGTWLGNRTKSHAYGHLFEAGVALAVFLLVVPWAFWLGFDGRCLCGPVLWCLPGISALGLSLFARWWLDCAIANLYRHRAFDALVTPENLLASACVTVTLAMSEPLLGPLLHGICLASTLVLLAACAAFEPLGICSSHLRKHQRAWLTALLAGALVTSAAAAVRVLPVRVVRDSPHPIIHYEFSATSDLKISSTQRAFHVFSTGHLRFSTLDHERWAEALTRPALSRVDCPRRALVMSLGEGLIERELLGDTCITLIDSIVRDGAMFAAARREPWWREITKNAWYSSRVHAQVIDPARWLITEPAVTYDLLVVDLPDPDDFVNVKYYTRHFYRELARRIAPNGVLVVQATSALRSPNTFASIQATVRSAGLNTIAYRVAMTTLGEWSFLLAQRHPIAPVQRPQWLRRTALAAAETFALAPDGSPNVAGQISRLNEPAVLDAFLHEGGDNAL